MRSIDVQCFFLRNRSHSSPEQPSSAKRTVSFWFLLTSTGRLSKNYRTLLIAIAMLLTFRHTSVGQSGLPALAADTGGHESSLALSDGETVSPASGNLQITIPILSLPQRAGAALNLSITYNSGIWNFAGGNPPFIWYATGSPYFSYPGGITPTLLYSRINGGVTGWDVDLGFPRLYWTSSDGPNAANTGTCGIGGYSSVCSGGNHQCDVGGSGASVQLPDGSIHTIPVTVNCTGTNTDTNTTFANIEPQVNVVFPDDLLVLNLDTINNVQTLKTPNGTTYEYDGKLRTSSNPTDVAQFSLITDRNGNQLQQDPSGTITDTVGRSISVITSSPDSNGTYTKTISVPTENGGTNQTVIVFNKIALSPTIPLGANESTGESQAGNNAAIVVGAVLYPNGTQYTMSYNEWGEVTKITYPSGGYTRYDYTSVMYSSPTWGRYVQAKHRCVLAQGNCSTSTEETTSFTYSLSASAYVASTTYPDQHTETRTWSSGARSTVTKESNGAVLKTVSETLPTTFFLPSIAYPNCTTQQFQQTLPVYEGLYSIPGTPGATSSTYGLVDGLPLSTTTTLQGGISRNSSYVYDSIVNEYTVYSGWTATPTGTATCTTYLSDKAIEINSDYAGNSIRKVVTQYNSSYRIPQIAMFHLPVQTQIYANTSASSSPLWSLAGQTTLGYDETSISDPNTNATHVSHASSYGTGFSSRGNLTSISRWNNSGPSPSQTWRYDIYGNVTASIDGNNNLTSSTYNDNFAGQTCVRPYSYGFVTAVTNALGQTSTTKYYPCNGRIAAKQDPNDIANGRSGTQYTYDAMYNVLGISFPDGGSESYSYFDYSIPFTIQKTVTLNQNQNIVNKAMFDGIGRKIQTQNISAPGGAITTDVAFNQMGYATSMSQPYQGTANGFTTFQYDGLGRQISVALPDLSHRYTCYNGAANAAQSSCPTGAAFATPLSTISTTDEAGNIVTSGADSLGSLAAILEPGGLLTSYSSTVLGDLSFVSQAGLSADTPRVRNFTYNSLSQLLTSSNPETGLICYGTWQGSNCVGGYDYNGNLVSKTDARNVVSSYTYDALNRLTSKTYTSPASVASTSPSTFIYDAALSGSSPLNAIGRLVSEFTGPSYAPITQRSILGYDAMGRVSTETQCVTAAGCSNTPNEFQYSYDFAGHVSYSSNGVASMGIGLTSSYDGAGRISKITSTWDDSTHPSILFAPPSAGQQYGAFGLIAASYGVPDSGLQSAYSEQKNYDSRMRVLSDTYATAGQGISATGQIVIGGTEQQATAPGTASTGTITISGLEGFTQVCPPNSHTHSSCTTVYDTGSVSASVNSFTASAAYRQGSTSSTVAQALAGALNASGSPVTATASGGVVTLTSIATGPSANFVYSVSSSSGGDFTGAVSNGTTTGTLAGGSGGILYDAGAISVTIQGQNPVSYTWGAADTPQSIASSLATSLQTALNGFVNVSVSGSTVSLTAGHAGSSGNLAISGQVSDTVSQFASSPSFTVAASGMSGGSNGGTIYAYSIPSSGGYAPNGNLLLVSDSVTGTWAYSYDSLDRLITAQASANPGTGYDPWGSLNFTWTYDSFGNNQGHSVSGSGPAVTNATSYSFTGNNQIDGYNYDAAGNQLSDPSGGLYAYSYDAEGRVASTSSGTSYIYDAEGRRVAKLNSNGQIVFQYLLGLGGEQVSELDGSGNWLHSNAFVNGKLLATYAPSGLHFQLSDWLGTKRVQASAAGTIEESCQSLAYGDNLNCSGAVLDAAEQHFTDKERDSESGLDYFGARYYSSNGGRFMSPDWAAQAQPVPYAKLDNPQSLNLYGYMLNNPLAGVDPDGHNPFTDWVKSAWHDTTQAVGKFFGGPKGSVSVSQTFSLPVVNAQEEDANEKDMLEMQHGAALEPIAPGSLTPSIQAQTWNLTTEPGPLGTGQTAQSFAGGQYSKMIVPEGGQGFNVYRVWGGDAPENGRFFSPEPQVGGIQSQIDLALRPEWGNTASSVSCINLPAGTVTYVGTSASQGGAWVGGTIQIFVPNPPKP